MKTLRKTLCATVLACASAVSSAATIEFGTGHTQWVQNYTEGEFRVVASTTQPFLLIDTSDCSPSCADNGSRYLGTLRSFAQGHFTPSVFVSKTDGSAFSFTSFESAEFPNSGDVMFATASGIRILGRLLDDSFVSEDFMFDGVNDGTGGTNDFQTFYTSRFGSVTELQFLGIRSAGTDFAVDNLVVNAAVPEVPEPSSIALLAAGFAGLFARRRNPSKC
jgi:hypothetical protein